MMKIHDHELTDRQIEILSFIYDYKTDYGFVPSIREICEATGIRSTSAVSYQINRLARSGYINKVDEVSRGMILMAPAYDAIGKQAPDECDFQCCELNCLHYARRIGVFESSTRLVSKIWNVSAINFHRHRRC